MICNVIVFCCCGLLYGLFYGGNIGLVFLLLRQCVYVLWCLGYDYLSITDFNLSEVVLNCVGCNEICTKCLCGF